MSTRKTLRGLREDLGQLVARHHQAGELQDFSRWADDPVGFIREVLGGDPWSRQVEIAESVRDHPLTVVRSANAVGKDWTAARLALWWVYACRGLALVTGPTERQVREVVMGEAARAFRAAPDLPGELYSMALRLGDDHQGGILAFTSTEASRLTGFHAPRVMAVLTEAQGVEDFAWEGLLACATGEEDRVLAVGNPLRPEGRFYTASRASGWRSVKIGAREHPNIERGKTVIPGGPSAAFVERIAREYGRDSGVYAARVEGEFPPEGSLDGLVRADWLEAAFARHEEDRGELGKFPAPVLALDVARSHERDENVMAVVQGPRLVRLLAWRSRDLVQTAERFLHAGDRVRLEWYARRRDVAVGTTPTTEDPEALHTWLVLKGVPDLVRYVDTPGIGGGVVDVIRNRGRRSVREYWGWNPASDDRRFANARAEVYWSLRSGLQDGTIALPRDPLLREELLAVEWWLDGKGRVQIMDKEALRKELGRSPDRADAATIALAGAMGLAVRTPSVTFDAIEVSI